MFARALGWTFRFFYDKYTSIATHEHNAYQRVTLLYPVSEVSIQPSQDLQGVHAPVAIVQESIFSINSKLIVCYHVGNQYFGLFHPGSHHLSGTASFFLFGWDSSTDGISKLHRWAQLSSYVGTFRWPFQGWVDTMKAFWPCGTESGPLAIFLEWESCSAFPLFLLSLGHPVPSRSSLNYDRQSCIGRRYEQSDCRQIDQIDRGAERVYTLILDPCDRGGRFKFGCFAKNSILFWSCSSCICISMVGTSVPSGSAGSSSSISNTW